MFHVDLHGTTGGEDWTVTERMPETPRPGDFVSYGATLFRVASVMWQERPQVDPPEGWRPQNEWRPAVHLVPAR